MNAAIVSALDRPPRYGSFDEPVAAAGEVAVRVTAAGLHPLVRSLASGSHYGSSTDLPFIAGVDAVGRLEDGRRVYFLFSRSPFGTFAEQCVAARSMCLAVPDALDDVTVAALVNPGVSSWAALRVRTRLEHGESVLILGATGVAGQLAVQIAKRLGAKRIVAAGRDPRALAELGSLGADAVISLREGREEIVRAFRREFMENNIDVVLDYVWGTTAEQALEAISQKGFQQARRRIRFLEIGASSGPAISLPAAALRSSGLEMYGSGFGSVPMERIFESIRELLNEAAKEPFRMKVERAPLNEVEHLWNTAQAGERRVFCP